VRSLRSRTRGNRSTLRLSDRPSFETLVSVACHDLRTPLATVHGFARTLSRVDLEEPAVRYVAMIEQASGQIAELLDELSLVTRISQGRFEPRLEEVDSLRLAQEAAAELEEGSVEVSGEGAPVRVEPDSARRAVRQLARAARRHGGLDTIQVEARGPLLAIGPLQGTAPPVVTGAEVRELGAAAAVWLVDALGGSVRAEDDVLLVELPS
jgi:signal transduction histidine kinase